MYERENARRLILIGIVIVVIVIVGGLFFLLRGSGSSSSTNGTPVAVVPVTVVVAVQPVPQGTQLTASQVNTYFKQTTITGAVPSDAFSTLNQLTAVISGAPNGSVTATQTIYQNSAVVPGMFTTVGLYRTGQTPSFAIPYGYDAEAVSFDTLNSVLGSINAGDAIDIMASFKGKTASTGPNGLGSLNPPPQTQFVLTDLRVISVNAPPTTPNGGASTTTVSATPTPAPATAPAAGGTLLVLVRYQQALELQHLKDFGWDISAVLRSAKQQTIPHLKTLPVTDKWFFVKTQTPLRNSPGY
jgi:Flp pilus assembly protein CpaB